MKHVTLVATAATVALLTVLAAPAGAVDMGCGTPGPTATVFSTAGSGEALGWAPDCVQVIAPVASPGSVAFTNLDPLFHQPVADGCFSQFQVNFGQTKVLEGLRVVNGKAYVGYVPCDESATQARTGTFIPRTEGEKLPVVETGVDGPGTVTVHYICAFHGPVMHGKIVLHPA